MQNFEERWQVERLLSGSVWLLCLISHKYEELHIETILCFAITGHLLSVWMFVVKFTSSNTDPNGDQNTEMCFLSNNSALQSITIDYSLKCDNVHLWGVVYIIKHALDNPV